MQRGPERKVEEKGCSGTDREEGERGEEQKDPQPHVASPYRQTPESGPRCSEGPHPAPYHSPVTPPRSRVRPCPKSTTCPNAPPRLRGKAPPKQGALRRPLSPHPPQSGVHPPTPLKRLSDGKASGHCSGLISLMPLAALFLARSPPPTRTPPWEGRLSVLLPTSPHCPDTWYAVHGPWEEYENLPPPRQTSQRNMFLMTRANQEPKEEEGPRQGKAVARRGAGAVFW